MLTPCVPPPPLHPAPLHPLIPLNAQPHLDPPLPSTPTSPHPVPSYCPASATVDSFAVGMSRSTQARPGVRVEAQGLAQPAISAAPSVTKGGTGASQGGVPIGFAAHAPPAQSTGCSNAGCRLRNVYVSPMLWYWARRLPVWRRLALLAIRITSETGTFRDQDSSQHKDDRLILTSARIWRTQPPPHEPDGS